MKIELRPLRDSDHNFIYATYIRNRFFDKNNHTTLKRATWSSLQHKRLEGILERNKGILVACLENDQDVILGYSLPEEDYVYIKLAWRSEDLKLKERLQGKV